jgi:site-specific recombinase XerD
MSSIRLFKKDDPSKGYLVDFGLKPDGKRDRRLFKTLADAERVVAEHTKEPFPTGALFDNRLEFLHCFQRLSAVGATIQEATDFFINFGARKGNPAISNLVEMLMEEKGRVGRKQRYLINLQKTYTNFVESVGKDTQIGTITEEQITKWIYEKYVDSSAVTKKNIIRNLSVLFNYGIKRNFIKLNPTINIERPSVKFQVPKVITPEDFQKLLNQCVRKKWLDRMVMFVLVGFCGVRAEEASQLKWADIDFDNKKVMVPADVAKKGSYRRNIIPDNAMTWLLLARDNRKTGDIFDSNWEGNQRSAVKSAKIVYSKNCVRHSFCSYSLEGGRSLADTMAMMGHTGSPAIVNEHYRNVVEPSAAAKWWKIVPDKMK